MLSRLNLLESHLTGLPIGTENLLQKYRKMSSIDQAYVDDFYYLGTKDTVMFYNKILSDDPHTFK